MKHVATEEELCFDATFDDDGLDVGMEVYETTSGSAVLLGSVTAMTNVPGTNGYVGFFTPEFGKRYYVNMAVYTDGDLDTRDTGRNQLSDSFNCIGVDADFSGVAASVASAVWDAELGDHSVADTFGAFVKKLLTLGKFIGLS